MCGIVGVSGSSNVNQILFDSLTVLQHRGQDSAGIVTYNNGMLNLHKGNGLVSNVFHTHDMQRLQGSVGIGHVRYPTAGSSSAAEAQPFYVNSPYGITLVHNGNLTNTDELRREVFQSDLRHISTSSDSEVLLNVFAHELQSQGSLCPQVEDIFKAIERVHHRCRGAYAVVAMIVDNGLIGFRDPHGIRPICYGTRETSNGLEYMLASESAALTSQGFSLVRDLEPGEAVYIDHSGNFFSRNCAANPKLSPCIFEHVYLARPDSTMDGISIHKARMRMGEKLANQILQTNPTHDIEVVMSVPVTSRTAAMRLASQIGIKYREGFVKNQYIGRTFIMPGQNVREKSVRQKLSAIELEFSGKNVLLVDDSIVRGTTSKQIVEMARDAGANKVYFASAAPAVCHPNAYGIDMPVASELIAHDRSTEQVRQAIGADGLYYQKLEDLISASQEGNQAIESFECSVFDGKYITGDIGPAYLEEIENSRRDKSIQGE